MEIKHYIKIMTKGFSIFPNVQVIELKDKTLKNVDIPKDALRITTFDKVYDTTLFGGKQIILTSDDLNVRSYQIGAFSSLDDLRASNKKDVALYDALEKQGCIGMIKNASGEHPLFKFEKYIDLNKLKKDTTHSNQEGHKE